MKWNHRVVWTGGGDILTEVREVFYNDTGQPYDHGQMHALPNVGDDEQTARTRFLRPSSASRPAIEQPWLYAPADFATPPPHDKGS
jgi:hypothetical protein